MIGIPSVVRCGPATWSTCTALARREHLRLCWDVNRYYRDLGIGWPYTDASRGDLRRAYLALDGPNNARLTYVFTQLLNGQVKAWYDAMPFGSVFPDRYTYEQQRLTGKPIAPGSSKESADTLSESLDSNGHPTEDEDAPEEYPYTVFLWGTDKYDPAVLGRWQTLLIQVATLRRLDLQISLGVMEGEGAEWAVGYQRDIPLVFVDRWAQPTREDAYDIIQGLLS